MKTTVAIIGAGPAGLTAAYLLSKNDVDVTVLEADPAYVGGISRTATSKGFHFDLGGHGFLSKSKAGEDQWGELSPDDLQGNFRRLGGATHQRSCPGQCDQERTFAAALQWRPHQSNQDADQLIPI